ncbi:hypothetical protein Ancab_020693 [Ancistrocladus abbreviatus]
MPVTRSRSAGSNSKLERLTASTMISPEKFHQHLHNLQNVEHLGHEQQQDHRKNSTQPSNGLGEKIPPLSQQWNMQREHMQLPYLLPPQQAQLEPSPDDESNQVSSSWEVAVIVYPIAFAGIATAISAIHAYLLAYVPCHHHRRDHPRRR